MGFFRILGNLGCNQGSPNRSSHSDHLTDRGEIAAMGDLFA